MSKPIAAYNGLIIMILSMRRKRLIKVKFRRRKKK
jgi:hypothetical protein